MKNQNMSYKIIHCKNCGNQFVWSQEEQALYAQRNLSAPEYCPICRGIMEARLRDGNRARMENNRISNIAKDTDE